MFNINFSALKHDFRSITLKLMSMTPISNLNKTKIKAVLRACLYVLGRLQNVEIYPECSGLPAACQTRQRQVHGSTGCRLLSGTLV